MKRKKEICQMKSIILTSCMILVMHISIQCTVEEFKGSPAEFETKLHEGKPSVVKFYEPWCPACKKFAPTFEKVSKEYPDVRFINVNCDNDKELALANGIGAYPTTKLYDAKGNIIETHQGALSVDALRNKIKNITTN
jgi:thioredoxin 1